MKNRKQYIEAIVEAMSSDDAAPGIHIDMIAQRLVMQGSSITQGQGFDELRALANRLILAECGKGRRFAKVYDPKTRRARRGAICSPKVHAIRNHKSSDLGVICALFGVTNFYLVIYGNFDRE